MLALGLVLGGCATPDAATSAAAPRGGSAAIPSYLTLPTGCAVLAGGGIGSLFADEQATAIWDRINATLTAELHERLLRDRQYRVIRFTVPTQRTGKAEDLVMAQLAEQRCNRLIQVSHQIAEDGAGRYFRFDVALFRIDPKPGHEAMAAAITVVTTAEFKHSYRYARTQQSLDDFHAGDFAEQVFADLTKSGVLAPLR